MRNLARAWHEITEAIWKPRFAPNARRDEGAYLVKYVTEEQQRSRRKDGLPRRGWPILPWLVAYPRLRTIQVRRTAVRLEPSQNRLSQIASVISCQALMFTALSMVFWWSDLVKAAEHPGHAMEHPGEEMEHAEEDFPVTASEVKQAIENYVKKDSDLKGGYFLVYDTQDKVVRQLKFERVHDRVSELKKSGEYFACSDFIAASKNVRLDLDFWLKNGEDGLEINKITIHKVAEKARYTFKDDEITPIE